MKKRSKNWEKQLEKVWKPKENKNYEFPRSSRYCYICERQTIYKYDRKIKHSICQKCNMTGLSQIERQRLGLTKKSIDNQLGESK